MRQEGREVVENEVVYSRVASSAEVATTSPSPGDDAKHPTVSLSSDAGSDPDISALERDRKRSEAGSTPCRR